ncbi:hypothetical protein O988_09645, partial [Pseudogymnoascus sp. VKM F-3808]
LSYFYPLPPTDPARVAFSTGTWPRDRATVPKTIYECDPPPSQGFASRMYTCFNEEIDVGFSGDVVVVPGAESKEAMSIKEGGIAASKVKVDADVGAPERIRDWQLKKADESPKCDGRTGKAVESLHWGAWEHSCFDGGSEWATLGRKVRGEVLRERAERDYQINMRIKRMWEEKNEEVKEIKKLGDGRGKEKTVEEREEQFWRESFDIREEGREVDGDLEREFERRMKGEVWGSFVEEHSSWRERDDECEEDEEHERPRECEKKKAAEKPKEAEKSKEAEKPKEPNHPTPGLGRSHYDRPIARKSKKIKPAEIKVKEKNGKIKIKVKDGYAEIRVKGKDGKTRVSVKDKAGKIKVKSG